MSDRKNMAWLDDVYIGTASQPPKTRRNRKNRTKQGVAAGEPGPCPCSVDQVYSLGINIQYYVGDIYLELGRRNQEPDKNQYKSLAMKQLDGKNAIEKLANINLTRLLSYFYNNGGPIIEPPLSEEMARDIQPFFTRISSNFMEQLDVIVDMVSKTSLSAHELEHMISGNVIDMYTTMSMLFPIDEIKDAFNDLIGVQEKISGN